MPAAPESEGGGCEAALGRARRCARFLVVRRDPAAPPSGTAGAPAAAPAATGISRQGGGGAPAALPEEEATCAGSEAGAASGRTSGSESSAAPEPAGEVGERRRAGRAGASRFCLTEKTAWSSAEGERHPGEEGSLRVAPGERRVCFAAERIWAPPQRKRCIRGSGRSARASCCS
eukprot:15456498-Alexandrium_andersonii.AAC.1